ncbi:multiheme c-type cytochrome [Aurantibacillus circumpalustris]|uniref:multiheme c-type cytochrome n=1 Tax=Aurantibacillus circumpalustris TaxID=3036359 RepID=UPI00295ACFC0|nr:multiheme c-type cytochrome [Aurantibacillus circumpalustris]
MTPNSIKEKKDTLVYLNHSDTAKYIGMNTCRQCHQSIYNTFIETGMGKSFDVASRKKSFGDFISASIYDRIANLQYRAYWNKDSLFIKEFRLSKKDTTHTRTEKVNYIIGSGQHTNSHMYSVNGYVHQMPMTYYTQKKHWDLPPGFENGVNTRFSRKIGLECMSCHNAYPEFVKGSENKFTRLPNGIDCERCHGPGSIHVAQRSTGSKVDTSKYIDYSIVNPAKLSIDAQFDICQRCHLQGNAVLKEGKSFYDFKPGQKLSDFISVFLPKYKNADDEFIMASHADRLKQSACFIKSYEKVKDNRSLKPYKEALTCVTCHNPHVSVKQTNKNVFNDACTNCHSNASEINNVHNELKNNELKNCVSCHMPASGSTDIPHVSVHDHYIRKPITKKEKDKIKTFIGLFSINEKNPDNLTKANAYIDQYSKFEQSASYLDSAIFFLKSIPGNKKTLSSFIQIYFIQQKYTELIALIKNQGEQVCDSVFSKDSYDNKDAWAAYRIGEAFSNTNDNTNALRWFKKAAKLAPYNLDFRNKLGSSLAAESMLKESIEQFEFILNENPKFVSAYSNLGYIKLLQGFPAEALRLYKVGEKLDPDNEALLLNLAAYYLNTKERLLAKKYLEEVIRVNPKNKKALAAIQQLNSL